jgi:hypothetical protein
MYTQTRLSIAMSTAAGALALSLSANAAAPIVEITDPTSASIVYSPVFPFEQSIRFNLSATTKKQGGSEVDAALKDVGVLDVQVDEVGIVNGGTPIGNPFTAANACATVLTTSPNSCSTIDSDNASVTVPWTVTQPGSYTIAVSAKIQNAEGEDEEVVLVALATAEYPAPPAVANAFIKANPGVLASKKQHGCVISKIADEHAKYETFGPKGGPYNEPLIQEYVVSFASTCPLK